MQQGTDEREQLEAVWTVAKAWHRSAAELYKEIEDHDYREEQGVFFRHLTRRAWRINRFQYLWWRRLPMSATGDVRVKQFSDFLLTHLEPTITALLTLSRHLLAEREAAAVHLEQQEGPGSKNGDKP